MKYWRNDIAGTAVGFVGASPLGMQLIERLLAADRVVVTTSACTKDTADRLSQLEPEVCERIGEIGPRVGLVVVCANSDSELVGVATGSDGLLATMRPGSVLVSHATVCPSTIESLARFASVRGVDVVDAPISGTLDDAAVGHLTVFVGGTANVASRVRPVLAAYANPVLHIGVRGSAMQMKLINDAGPVADAQATLDTVAQAGDGDGDGDVQTDLLARTWRPRAPTPDLIAGDVAKSPT